VIKTLEARLTSRSSSTVAPAPTEARTGARRAVSIARSIALFVGALLLFVGALQLMKTGAGSLDILQNKGALVRNPGATFGLGWVGALFVLSGSPMAASALTLVAGGAITEIEGFTMLTGSRLGAAFVVLVVAVIYALKGGAGERMKPVSTAVMALSTTALVYVPAALLGWVILHWGPFHALDIQFPHQFTDVIDLIYGGMLARVESWNPALIFLGGLGVLLVSFKLIDSVMPAMNEKALGAKRAEWVRRKWPMFALGSLVALVTMSVSVALTVLVPLVSKRYVKRQDILPYIMGANITTLGDTMLAAFALHSPAAVRIVLAEVIATSFLSVLILAFLYEPVQRLIWRFQKGVLRSTPRLACFTAGLFLAPVAVIVGSNLLV
jgi:solute carrier family 34 (sodium-dependent phosphate cotransporter)